ncbi:metallophosphatase family protein [Epibacterium ulvae]|nr:metallophosphatase family protein [Epibacterium ulvae]
MEVGERWAVIADCHGNADALAATLTEIDRLGATRILNLGDHASGPLAAAETLDLIMASSDMTSVRGNHDRYLLGDPATLAPSDAVAYAELTPDHLRWLADLPATLRVDDLFLCHATPARDDVYWLQDVTATGQVVQRARAEVDGFAADHMGEGIQIYLCGHTHVPGIVQLSDGALVVNPGSVGLPGYDDDAPVPHVVESGDPAARFALIERAQNGWQVELRRVTYDASRMVGLALKHQRPGWARVLETGWYTT